MKTKLSIFALAMLSTQAFAQKAPIDHSVYDLWQSISSHNISKKGNYVFYTISPQEGDVETVLKSSNNSVIKAIPRGTQGKLNTAENQFLVTIKPFFKETRQAKIKKTKADDMPKDSLAIVTIGSHAELKNLGAIKNYKTAFNFDNYVAFTQELDIPTKQDSSKIKVDTNVASKSKAPKKEAVLILHRLSDADTVQFWKADSYSFSNDEKYLVFNKKTAEKDSSNVDGLYLYDITKKELKKISNGKGTYKSYTFDDQSNQLIFLADKSPAKNQIKDFKLYYYNTGLDSAKVIADKSTPNVPANWYVSGEGNLQFNNTGRKVFFGLAPIPAVKDTSLVDFEHAKVDIWHWQDETLMTQQLVNVKRDMNRSYLTAYDINSGKLTPLINEKINRYSFADGDNQEWILATSNFGRTIETQWQMYSPQDIYLISTNTGEQKLVKKDWVGQAYLSPDANTILLYNSESKNWYVYNVKTQQELCLNENMPVDFADELNDMPMLPSSYGIAAWASDYKGIYLNDRYDIWYFSFDGKVKENITNLYGRSNRIVLRLLNIRKPALRDKAVTLSKKERAILTSYNENNKENGFFELQLSKKNGLKEIIQDKYIYKSIQSDENNKKYIYTKENFNLSPNIFLSSDFKQEVELTNINAQQEKYNWGTAELVSWTTPKGYSAEGILYKPEDFDPNKKYPIIAYFYETSTEGLYSYQAPAPTPSRLNIPYYVSNGYLVFSPDIRYENGHPGQSAEEYINSGMQYLANTYSWVDSTKMAIQGQSWGGYQVAHLITRTNMYAAAWTGAPVVNMTSAYGGIRWQSGMSRQFQYEKTQSRIGKTLWEAPELYIENSPLFFMDRVNTPVAIMHNDNDGAVPWYQGIEMFTALRRLQKPVWLLNYNGDEHNLMQRQNRKDIQIRQAQFFDHFLKGKPAPQWIKSGVPAIEKGINWGLEIK